jgi:hypothetical protein
LITKILPLYVNTSPIEARYVAAELLGLVLNTNEQLPLRLKIAVRWRFCLTPQLRDKEITKNEINPYP